MRRTRAFRTVGWLVCWLLEIPRIDDLDQAALDAHIAALAERDGGAARVARTSQGSSDWQHVVATDFSTRSSPARPLGPAGESSGVPPIAETG